MPTDLQRIELAFPAEAMLHVVDHGADTRDPDAQRVRWLLVGTVDETLAGLVGRDLRKVRTRLDRTIRAFLGPIVTVGGRVDVIGLIAWTSNSEPIRPASSLLSQPQGPPWP